MNAHMVQFTTTMCMVFWLTACGRPETTTTVSQEKIETQAAQYPQFAHSKIDIPSDFSRALPLPSELQLEWHKHNSIENTSVLEGLMAGKMSQLIEPLNGMMQQAGWQSNLLLKQATNTLMHYTKDGESVIIELREAPKNVTIYNVTYTPHVLSKNKHKSSSANSSDAKATTSALDDS